MQKNKLVISFIYYTSVFLLIHSCAHQLSPRGGPSDTSGPEIITSAPSDGALNVQKNSKISILYSEWIAKKNLKIVSIYPPLKHKIKITKNRLDILPSEPMADSQTYHVIISSKLSDLHGNAFKSSHSLVFSTGAKLDSGTLSGCIVDPSTQNRAMDISLFNNVSFKDSGYSGTPAYKIESDSNGAFSLNFIKQGKYRIAGFPMISTSTRAASSGSVYITEDSIISVSSTPDTLHLYPAVIDTGFPSLSTIKTDNRKFAVCTWKKIVDTTVFKITSKLIRGDTSNQVMPFTSVQYGTADRFALLPGTPFSVAPWKFIYTISRIFDTTFFSDTVLFNSTDLADTIRPSVRTAPSTTNHFIDQEIALLWSEPVKINSKLFVFDSLGDTVFLKCNSGYNDTTHCTLSRTLLPGARYKLILFANTGSDLTGNQLFTKDSSDTAASLSFSTISPDSIAISIQGNGECTLFGRNSFTKWIYYPKGKNYKFISVDKPTGFFFDSIPAGHGTIGLFLDKNNNNQADPGMLIPWRAPEPSYLFADTIEARPRWEVEGITLQKCEPCTQQEIQADSTDATSE